ncbi:hypothetical protein ACFY1P_20225 [Streptomyces sp. NPDC001407]|uniref:hypothetical protein n=1 Tax=Streptomyces sp. NPDC001407 TaxID=3364573 RepID=UPI0036C6F329
MTTPAHGRTPLGNGVRAIIPSSDPRPSERAARALAPFQHIPVPAGVIEAARHLIEPLLHGENEQDRASAEAILAHFDAAIAQAVSSVTAG